MDRQQSPDDRASELLCRVLPETQWAQLRKTGFLEVSGFRRTYRIYAHGVTRVLDSQTRQPIALACLELSVPAPAHDRMIAEYVLIRNDEELYWRTANIFSASLDDQRLAVILTALFDAMLLATLFVQLRG
jgi:hypothetical protein